jgi:hypothetical protein
MNEMWHSQINNNNNKNNNNNIRQLEGLQGETCKMQTVLTHVLCGHPDVSLPYDK